MVIEEIIEKIEENNRKNTIYIHPIISNDKFAKYICAFANSEGGLIILGVQDDGMRLNIKNFSFTFQKDKIRNILDNRVKFKFNNFKYKEHNLAYIEVEKNKEKISLNNNIYVFNTEMEVQIIMKKKVFLSYCHKDKCIADIVESTLENKIGYAIEISRDEHVVKYKDSLERFMQSINKHDFVISIISDSYLKSDACMYEVTELMRDRNYYDRLLFIIISDEDIEFYKDKSIKVGADIYTSSRFEYIEYWQEKKNGIDSRIRRLNNPALTGELADESKQLEIIALNIGEFIQKLKDGLGVSFQEMVSSEFNEIISIILEKAKSSTSKELRSSFR